MKNLALIFALLSGLSVFLSPQAFSSTAIVPAADDRYKCDDVEIQEVQIRKKEYWTNGPGLSGSSGVIKSYFVKAKGCLDDRQHEDFFFKIKRDHSLLVPLLQYASESKRTVSIQGISNNKVGTFIDGVSLTRDDINKRANDLLTYGRCKTRNCYRLRRDDVCRNVTTKNIKLRFIGDSPQIWVSFYGCKHFDEDFMLKSDHRFFGDTTPLHLITNMVHMTSDSVEYRLDRYLNETDVPDFQSNGLNLDLSNYSEEEKIELFKRRFFTSIHFEKVKGEGTYIRSISRAPWNFRSGYNEMMKKAYREREGGR